MSVRNLFYALCCLSFSTVIGGAVYEHVATVPTWSMAPPASLSMFQGEYGLNSEPFWMNIHPVTLLLFLVALIMHWKTDRRRALLIPLGGYILVLITTAIYFVPELLAIIQTEYATTPDPGLTERAGTWELLSIVRLVFLMIMATVLYLGLTRSDAVRK